MIRGWKLPFGLPPARMNPTGGNSFRKMRDESTVSRTAMPDIHQARQIGTTTLRVTRLGLGTVALGFLYEKVPDQRAYATIQCARDLGLNLFDTAPLYGDG